MNIKFSSPAVCVIDDDPEEYETILKALLRLGIGAVHVNGNSIDNLPPDPIKGLRLVFLDLHLNSASSDKDRMSHTANVFSKVVPIESPLVVVIIWSKYSDEKDKFKETLLKSKPEFKEHLIFIPMPKLQANERPDDWGKKLKDEIKARLQNIEAFDVLWGWETLVKDAGSEVSNEIYKMLPSISNDLSDSTQSVDDEAIRTKKNEDLKLLFQTLVHEQGEPDCNEDTVSRHLVAVLAQLLTDHLEHANAEEFFKDHTTWLCDKDQAKKTEPDIASQINGVLLTASAGSGMSFIPGTVYRIKKESPLQKYFDCESNEDFKDSLSKQCLQCKVNKDKEDKDSHENIFIEISPACDAQQNNRKNIFLLGGILHKVEKSKHKKAESNQCLSQFCLRWNGDVLNEGDNVILSVCSWYKLTLNSKEGSDWLIPWFRLRELPTTSLRNWYASHSSRVGYMSLNIK